MRVAFVTLGCKVNQDETAGMEELFRRAGWTAVGFDQPADVYIVNTCTVTHLASRKSRQMLRRARRLNPGALVVALGCYPQAAPGELEQLPQVDIVAGNKAKPEIVQLVQQALAGGEVEIKDLSGFFTLPVAGGRDRHRAFLRIQDGCRNFCTYCIVPTARGELGSMPPAEVVARVGQLEEKGYREIVLTGINLSSYGRETGHYDLASLLDMLKHGPARIRISSMEPHDLDQPLLEAIAGNPRICQHFHIPLQSGSDNVLANMGRRYSSRDYLDLVEELRQRFDCPGISTDIIVGFPGESEEDFAATRELVKKAEFARIHVFRFSPRPGTPAAGLPQKVDDQISANRSRLLIELGEEVAAEYAAGLKGRREQLLVEADSDLVDGVAGYGSRYLRIHCRCAAAAGELVDVRISGIQGSDLLAEAVEKQL